MPLFPRKTKPSPPADPLAAQPADRQDELAAARRDLMLAALESLSEEEPKQEAPPPRPATSQPNPPSVQPAEPTESAELANPAELPESAAPAEPVEPAQEPEEETHDWRAAQVVMWDIVQQDIKRLRDTGRNGHPETPHAPESP